ncbi:hypothetical protein [Roseisolibacter sp. H3M3-2]|uniref:hypothetical protein n=1 Tax=Roseisolibacter sp. H3M3-2 TaxID=3031323 RepID=UPI0023DAD73C|nr:hypothetical protein [Roseisolibacter sp. H3M3-2]MDF1502787.1 hypothetical protein [Roseisolibacter sp. H3M3-2]
MRALPLVLLLSAAAGCAGRFPRLERTVLTRDQLRDGGYPSLYEAVTSLRGGWLRARSPATLSSRGRLWVYVDDRRLGGTEALRDIAPDSVRSVRLVDGATATVRWGLEHGDGVIEVATTRR